LLNHAAGGPADVNLFVAGVFAPVDGVDGEALGGAHREALTALEASAGVAVAAAEAAGLEAEVGGGGYGEDGRGGRGDIDAGERGVEGEGHRDAVGAEAVVEGDHLAGAVGGLGEGAPAVERERRAGGRGGAFGGDAQALDEGDLGVAGGGGGEAEGGT